MMKKVSTLVTFLSGAIILLTINRKTNLTQQLLQPFEFLRWQDFHAMVSLPLIITVIYVLLFIQIIHRQVRIPHHFGKLLLLFTIGVLLYGVSSGNHEVTNYLHHRFCIEDLSSICQIIRYNDDSFSHIIFYISSILMTLALLLFEKFQPEPKPVPNKELALILFNACLISVGIFMNLAFEQLGIDLYAFGILSIISAYLLWNKRNKFRSYPIITYCAIGYGSGTVVSFLYQLVFS